MKHRLSAVALVVLLSVSASASEGLSGTWTTESSAGPQTFVFKVRGDRFDGIVCGPCDDPSSVFRIEDGRLTEGDRATFHIAYDVGGPLFKKVGPYRADVSAALASNQLTLSVRRDGGNEPPVATVLKRVVESYQGINPSVAAAVAKSAWSKPEPLPVDGKWVANGRVTQQNFILKVRDNKVWGLVCGPCNPDGVFMIDDGTLDGDSMTFYINHLDTPASARKTGVNRNIMRGTRVGNVMKFKWVREGAEDQPGGEMVLIGPIRQ